MTAMQQSCCHHDQVAFYTYPEVTVAICGPPCWSKHLSSPIAIYFLFLIRNPLDGQSLPAPPHVKKPLGRSIHVIAAMPLPACLPTLHPHKDLQGSQTPSRTLRTTDLGYMEYGTGERPLVTTATFLCKNRLWTQYLWLITETENNPGNKNDPALSRQTFLLQHEHVTIRTTTIEVWLQKPFLMCAIQVNTSIFASWSKYHQCHIMGCDWWMGVGGCQHSNMLHILLP